MIRIAIFMEDSRLAAGLARSRSGTSGGDISVVDPAISPVDVAVCAPSPRALSFLKTLIRSNPVPPALLLLTDSLQGESGFFDMPFKAWGVLDEQAELAEIEAAVRALHEGIGVAPGPLLREALEELSVEPSARVWSGRRGWTGRARGPDPGDGRAGGLTGREREVLALLAAGLANKQIAGKLGISERTVKFHTSSLYGKLGATNRAEAVAMGIRRGLLDI